MAPRALVDSLNERFAHGRPSDVSGASGVAVQAFDFAPRVPPWEPCHADGGPDYDRDPTLASGAPPAKPLLTPTPWGMIKLW